MCCFLFNCLSYVIDALQRLLQFAFGMVICVVVTVALLMAIGVGIAYGYNYSLVEYISLKEPHQSVFLKKVHKEDTEQSILRQMNEFYKLSMNKLLRVNYNRNKPFILSEKLKPTVRQRDVITSNLLTFTSESHNSHEVSEVTERIIIAKKSTHDYLLHLNTEKVQHSTWPYEYQKEEPETGKAYEENDRIILQTFQPVDVFIGTPISVTRTRRRVSKTTAWTFDPDWGN